MMRGSVHDLAAPRPHLFFGVAKELAATEGPGARGVDKFSEMGAGDAARRGASVSGLQREKLVGRWGQHS